MEKILEKVETKLNDLLTREGIKKENVDYFYKLVDIHKDIKNEEYWKAKEEKYKNEIRRIWCKNERQQRPLHG